MVSKYCPVGHDVNTFHSSMSELFFSNPKTASERTVTEREKYPKSVLKAI